MSDTTQRIILYADDDPDDRELLTATIEKVDPGYTVIAVENGRKLIRKLEELMDDGIEPCLIILDMNMPVMNGRETLEKIRRNQNWEKLPVAIFTTSSAALYKQLIETYKVPFVTKPAKLKTMYNEVAQLLSCCSQC